MKRIATLNKWIAGSGMALALLFGSGLPGMAQISTTVVTVYDTAVSPTSISGASAVCNGAAVTLTVNGGSLGTHPDAIWTWYEGGCGNGPALGTGPALTINPVNTTNTPVVHSYYVRAEGGCNTTACASTAVTVNPTPEVTAPQDIIFCNNVPSGTITLAGNITGMTYDISGGADIGLADQTGVTAIPSFNTQNLINLQDTISRTISITPTANGCTGTPVTFSISVMPAINMDSIGNAVACNNTSVSTINFNGTPQTGISYKWSNNNTGIGLAANGTGPISAFIATNASCNDVVATVTVTPEFTRGNVTCLGSAKTFTITVHPSPNGTLTSGGPVCAGTAVALTFNSSCGTGDFVLEIKQDGNPATAPYYPYSNVQSGVPFNITPDPATGGTHTYDLMKITDSNGCQLVGPNY